MDFFDISPNATLVVVTYSNSNAFKSMVPWFQSKGGGNHFNSHVGQVTSSTSKFLGW